MRKLKHLYIAVILASIILTGSYRYLIQKDNVDLEVMQKISTHNLYNFLSVLASDSLEGRETTFPGQKKAARFISDQFADHGLQPLGEDGSYFQSFPVTKVLIDSSTFITTITPDSKMIWKSFGVDYLAFPVNFDTTVTAMLEFVGYGSNIPGADFCEYDSLKDYTGKIIVVLDGSPWDNDTSAAAMRYKKFFTLNAKRSNAVSRNAAGLVIVYEADSLNFQDMNSELRDILLRGRVTLPQRLTREMPILTVSQRLGNHILNQKGCSIHTIRSIIDGKKKPFSFSLDEIKISLSVTVRRTTEQTENVIGIVPGTDQVLKNEYLIITAHYDHIGTNMVSKTIFHGADDDGSGTAAVLELSRIFSTTPARRSIIFMLVTGEEKGLLGSLYYSEHPTVALEKIICDINIDMVGRIDPEHEHSEEKEYIYIIGDDKLSSEVHTLSELANSESVNLKIDYRFNDDNEPNHFYRRSDHYNFAKHDIPVIFYFNGTHEDYHQSTDTIDKIDFYLLRKRTQLIFYTAWKISNADTRPRIDFGTIQGNRFRQ